MPGSNRRPPELSSGAHPIWANPVIGTIFANCRSASGIRTQDFCRERAMNWTTIRMHHIVGVVRFELTWNLLLFQLRIRQRRYTPISDWQLTARARDSRTICLYWFFQLILGVNIKRHSAPAPSHPSGFLVVNLYLRFYSKPFFENVLFVAGGGFEPPTSRLWAWRATSALPRLVNKNEFDS